MTEQKRVALVTGGGRGIGAAIAHRLAEDGMDIALSYQRDTESATKVTERIEAIGGRALAIRSESADPEAASELVRAVLALYERIDVVVNNAGAFHIGPIEELDQTAFDETIAVNVRAPFLITKAAIEHLPAGGRVVNIGSNVAERVAFPGFSLYAMSKAALAGLTKGLARELGPRGITVNQINPGPIDTDLNPADGPGAETVNGFTALGRYGMPAEIAATVSHLVGDGGGYTTGARFAVDGGFNI